MSETLILAVAADELARLRRIEQAVRDRIARHDKQVHKAGGKACQDEFCRTFKPLVRR